MMEYGVYLESSIVDLKPRVLDFLTKLVEKAKEMKEYAVAFKKKELAEITGKDIRTTARYLKELEERNVITTKGVRGRAGGTVILFNAELIRFDTSDKAFINSDEPISIDDIVEQKLPKKQPEPEDPKKPKRDRKTKQQMIEARALQAKKQSENDKINDELEKLGGIPNWAWFQLTKDPVGNYKTYLLSRLYNRYAALFVDENNVDIDLGRAESNRNYLKTITDDYDVLPARFYRTGQWTKFEELRIFCDDNDIDPSKYLSAQFNRSVFEASTKNHDKKLPFVNGIISDTAYDNYLLYVKYQKNSTTFKTYFQIPAQFMNDFVVRAITEAYETAEERRGLLQYLGTIRSFFKLEGFGEKEEALLNFYDIQDDEMRKLGVSKKSQNVIKRFILLQSLIQSYGISGLPEYVIFGSEMVQILLASIDKMVGQNVRATKERVLGALALPKATLNEMDSKGKELYNRMLTLYETPKVLRLITERKGLNLTLADLNAAFREYGKKEIPLDDFSMLDTDQIIEVVRKSRVDSQQEYDYKEIIQKREYELKGSIVNDDVLENLLSNL